MRATTIAILFSTLLGGCGGVLSKVPASEGTATRYDRRLVGFWRVDFDATPGGVAPDSRDESILAIGRRAGTDGTLQLVTVTLRHDESIETIDCELAPTTIAEKDYASLQVMHADEASKREPQWVVMRYEMSDADTVRVLSADEKAVAADVRSGTVPGRVSEGDKAPPPEVMLTVTLEASTAALREYIAKKGDGIWRLDRPLVLHRLRLK